MKNYAIIPARGGSKRIPHKNIKIFNGKPLIHWTINNLLTYEMFDEIIITTDSKDISKECSQFNVRVIENRPSELSDDFTPTLPVIKYVLEQHLPNMDNSDNVVCIYPTAVLLKANTLRQAKSIFEANNNQFVIAASKYNHPIERSFNLNQSNNVTLLFSENIHERTQKFNHTYHDAGQFYWGDKALWLTSQELIANSTAVTISNWQVQDIDTLEDWRRAELLHQIESKLDM